MRTPPCQLHATLATQAPEDLAAKIERHVPGGWGGVGPECGSKGEGEQGAGGDAARVLETLQLLPPRQGKETGAVEAPPVFGLGRPVIALPPRTGLSLSLSLSHSLSLVRVNACVHM